MQAELIITVWWEALEELFCRMLIYFIYCFTHYLYKGLFMHRCKTPREMNMLKWIRGKKHYEIYSHILIVRYYMEPHGFRNLVNAVNKLTFIPTLIDNNMTLTCVANKSEPERLEHVSVTLNVTCEQHSVLCI